MTSIPRSASRFHYAVFAAAFCAFVLAALIANRAGVRLSFDGYYYVERAKFLRHNLPVSFGDAWPFGWPLVGAAAGLAGLSAYHGLVAASVASVVGILFVAARLFPVDHFGVTASGLVLAAGASLFSVSTLVAGVLSEIPFAFILILQAFCLDRWPRPWAIAASAIAALAAFSLRYVGIAAFAVVMAWTAMSWRTLDPISRRRAALWLSASAGGAALLLAWNYFATGYLGGAARGGFQPASSLPATFADFGWSLSEALAGLAPRRLFGFETWGYMPVGLALLGGVLAVGTRAMARPPVPAVRALGLTILTYTCGFLALRMFGSFDSIGARVAIPLVFPLLAACAWLFAGKRALVIAGCAAVILVNGILIARGNSLQVSADVHPAVEIVASALRPGDRVGANDDARTIAARLRTPVDRIFPGTEPKSPVLRFLVVAGPPLDREGKAGPIDPEWRAAIRRLVREGGYRVRLEQDSLQVLELEDVASRAKQI